MTLLLFFSLSSKHALAKKSPGLVINGKSVKTDVSPFIERDRSYAPVRFVSEALGAEVEYHGDIKEKTGFEALVTITQKNGRQISISEKGIYSSEGITYFLLDDAGKGKAASPFIRRNDRIFLPIRALGNIFHMDVNWDFDSYKVTLDTNAEETIYPMYVLDYDKTSENMTYIPRKEIPQYHMQWKNGNYILKEANKTIEELVRSSIIDNPKNKKNEYDHLLELTNDINNVALSLDQSYFLMVYGD